MTASLQYHARVRPVLMAAVALLAAASLQPGGRAAQQPDTGPLDVTQAGILELQAAMRDGRTSSRAIIEASLARLARLDGTLRATLAVNPRAQVEADTRDREREAGRVRGPLHGIPIALKDNIQTTGMPTTGGALAFAGSGPRSMPPSPSGWKRQAP
jgi:amidase